MRNQKQDKKVIMVLVSDNSFNTEFSFNRTEKKKEKKEQRHFQFAAGYETSACDAR